MTKNLKKNYSIIKSIQSFLRIESTRTQYGIPNKEIEYLAIIYFYKLYILYYLYSIIVFKYVLMNDLLLMVSIYYLLMFNILLYTYIYSAYLNVITHYLLFIFFYFKSLALWRKVNMHKKSYQEEENSMNFTNKHINNVYNIYYIIYIYVDVYRRKLIMK